MRIKVKRNYLEKVTTGAAKLINEAGVLLMDFKTVELPWLDNQRGISCIPEGVYNWSLYQSPAHGVVILLEDVPDRSYIEMHVANFTREIRGCFAVGLELSDIDGDGIIDVKNSRNTFNRLLSLCGQSGTIEVR